MTAIDPYRTLEVGPGASQAEIKGAYRRLAKLYHPDSAGERALPRFLAIQAAYEILVVEPGRPRTAAGRASTARPAPAPSPAWQADASRARATREAYRARTRRGTAPSGATGSSSTTGGAAGPSGRTGDQTRPAGGTPGTGSAQAPGTGTGPEDATGTGGRTKRSSRRTKATIGSTSYDGADREPFDPAWEGATWYGAGSGTYWTINAKEYADPRKHGPEYLARSRRATEATEPTAVERPAPESAPDAAPADAPPGPPPEPPSEARPGWAPTWAAEPSSGSANAAPDRAPAGGLEGSAAVERGGVVGTLLGWIRRVRWGGESPDR